MTDQSPFFHEDIHPTNHLLRGSHDRDTIYGGDGNDTLIGLAGNDVLKGKNGHDRLFGDAGADTIMAGAGDDDVSGWRGSDHIKGGNGNDTLSGDDQNDVLSGGNGHDVMYGDRVPVLDPLPVNQEDILQLLEVKPDFSSWGLLYYGDEYTVENLQASTHDMLVINPAKGTSPYFPDREQLWKASEIVEIQSAGKEVLGYVSIGKINTFLTQWDEEWRSPDDAPSWLAEQENDNTYKVNFEEKGWQDIVFERVKMMIHQQFDGTFLDDVLEYYNRISSSLATEPYVEAVAVSAEQMRDFIADIRTIADEEVLQRDGILNESNRFKLMVNGAPYILQDAVHSSLEQALTIPDNQDYLHAIDYFVAENYVSQYPQYLDYASDVFKGHDISLFSLDTDQVSPQQRLETITRALKAGFMPYTTENNHYDTLNADFLTELVTNAPVSGDDVLMGGAGRDTLYGGGRNDTLNGGQGTDQLYGGKDDDWLYGGNGNDVLRGESGKDVINGDNGNDTLVGGNDNNTLVGGVGSDVFSFEHIHDIEEVVTNEIADFAIGHDVIDLSQSNYFTDFATSEQEAEAGDIQLQYDEVTDKTLLVGHEIAFEIIIADGDVRDSFTADSLIF
jgi:uncharacterized protein (TIGR01370 family)